MFENIHIRKRLLSPLIICLLGLCAVARADSPRQRIRLDDGWRFALGHAYDPARDFNFSTGYFFNAKAASGDGPAAAKFDDSHWRLLDLPHDWAVELPFDPGGDVGHGAKLVGRAYPDSSVGWYRKTFDIPASDLGRRISVQFDGAFRDAQVFLNGHFLGRFPSGYDGFRCDLTDVLNYGGSNVLSVRLDATLKEGWFYEGAGIYRHVWLIKTGPLHLAQDGVFVTTDVAGDAAQVVARVQVVNETSDGVKFDIQDRIVDPDGNTVAQSTISGLDLQSGDSGDYEDDGRNMYVDHARLWSPDSPSLYRLITTIAQNGQIVDQYETTFGIRTLRFDKDQGFFLNGQHLLIKGVCCHQDHAGVGVALPDALQAFRVLQLKKMGANALRTSHNPPTPELLDACDRLGMLVLDENRQTGTSDEAMGGLKKLILRDRNHPCVFLWSLGNEEWAIEGNIVGQRIVARQRELVHRLDPSRLVTMAISGGWGNGSSNSLDVMGFNYFTHGNVDDYHAKHPDQPCIGTEEASTVSTRGIYFDDNANAHLSAYDVHAPEWANTAEKWVNFYATRPFVAGAFVWTGFDYRGEPTPFGWPAISSQFGILDTCGFPKDNFYYYQSCWTDAPMVHVLPHWNWPGKEGQAIDVWCYSNCDEVALSLNGQSLGRKTMKRFGHLEWSVPYDPGKLVATAYRAGQVVATDTVETTGDPAAIQLSADRSAISADGRDVSVITVSATDSQGRRVPTAMNLISFSLTGPGRIIGVGNGDPACHEADVCMDGKWKRSLFNGLAQIIVQSRPEAGVITLTASGDHLAPGTLAITTGN
ncbi:MAG TPA: beta-galactosidase GalA [Tepidisphaeraceae bacterium]|nr:beta-galactosidase GalA [Tepidisphaeraceae bacterium]